MGRRATRLGGGLRYHVVARGNNRRDVFIDDECRHRFLEILVAVTLQRGWHWYGYCLMGNRFHLAFQTPHPDLPAGMRDLIGRYATWFNQRHGVTRSAITHRLRTPPPAPNPLTPKCLAPGGERQSSPQQHGWRPELVFGTYGRRPGSGRLLALGANGRLLHSVCLSRQGSNGNGIGIPAALSIADIDQNGLLEIVTNSFDHGIDIFLVPGSGANCLPWPTGRGSLLRSGAVPATAP